MRAPGSWNASPRSATTARSPRGAPEAWAGKNSTSAGSRKSARPSSFSVIAHSSRRLAFCHKPSRVLLVTDLWWNYPADAPAAWKFGMDRIYRPVYNGAS